MEPTGKNPLPLLSKPACRQTGRGTILVFLPLLPSRSRRAEAERGGADLPADSAFVATSAKEAASAQAGGRGVLLQRAGVRFNKVDLKRYL